MKPHRLFTGGVLATTLIGCLVAGTSSVQAAAPASPVAAGDCVNLTVAQLSKVSFPADFSATPCTEPHTFETSRVVTVPTKFAKAGRTSSIMSTFGSTTCTKANANYLAAHGTSTKDRNLNFEGYWMLPSKSQWSAGARWLVCGGGSFDHTLKNTYPLTAHAYDVPVRQRLARWNKRTKLWVGSANCSSSACFVAAAPIKLDWPMKAKFPGRATIERQVNKKLEKKYGYRAGWNGPTTAKSWNNGWRYFYPMLRLH
ncbi:MAG: septum formation family protein [Candidatus Nanopelagicales bacterium]